MKLPKVIHVELREPYNGKRHFYFGSIAAIFDELSEEQIGIKKEDGGRKYSYGSSGSARLRKKTFRGNTKIGG